MPSVLIIVAIALAAEDGAKSPPQHPAKYKVGSEVIVVRETPLRVDNRAVKTLSPGLALAVEELQDGYLGVTVDRQGWVDENDVAPVDDAVEALEPAIASDPDNAKLREIHLRYACWREKWEAAVTDSTALIRLEPEEPGHYMERVYALTYKGDYDRAIADCNELIRRKWQLPYALLYRGWCWHKKDQLERSIADFNEALKHEADNETKSNILFYRAMAHRDRGEWEKSLDDFKEAMKRNWSSAEIFKEFAYLNFRMER